eukprot:TRINITY_DN7107_c0_g3_i1.p1 TRINITY_DN7107_c0_g3~~TRINITY_DN7107_c0_g3_i1.p1  ORF type:complete len:452 (+),score=114.60 TRINITY_DN7107_c0_g3_i1:129-1358(+)
MFVVSKIYPSEDQGVELEVVDGKGNEKVGEKMGRNEDDVAKEVTLVDVGEDGKVGTSDVVVDDVGVTPTISDVGTAEGDGKSIIGSVPVTCEETVVQELCVGDVIVSVDGQDVQQIRTKLERVCFTSTPHGRNLRIDSSLLAGPPNSRVKLCVKRNKNTGRGVSVEGAGVGLEREEVITVEMTRSVSLANFGHLETSTNFFVVPGGDAGNIAYLDLRTAPPSLVQEILPQILDTRALVLDVRSQTSSSIATLAPYLTKTPVLVANAYLPVLSVLSRGNGLESSENVSKQYCFPHPSGQCYGGEIVALINEQTISHGELTCLYLRACQPTTFFVGTQTNGGMAGSTTVLLPGHIEVAFSCVGFRDVEGNVIQGLGITPDLCVKETIEDLKEGRDVVLDSAFNYLQTKKKQ